MLWASTNTHALGSGHTNTRGHATTQSTAHRCHYDDQRWGVTAVMGAVAPYITIELLPVVILIWGHTLIQLMTTSQWSLLLQSCVMFLALRHADFIFWLNVFVPKQPPPRGSCKEDVIKTSERHANRPTLTSVRLTHMQLTPTHTSTLLQSGPRQTRSHTWTSSCRRIASRRTTWTNPHKLSQAGHLTMTVRVRENRMRRWCVSRIEDCLSSQSYTTRNDIRNISGVKNGFRGYTLPVKTDDLVGQCPCLPVLKSSQQWAKDQAKTTKTSFLQAA